MEGAVIVVLAYLAGAIPFAFLLARQRGIDLRHVGSGNVGAANVLRTSGVRTGVLAMCLDTLKGAVAVTVAERVAPGTAFPMAAGLAAIIGHVYPVWLRFQGGKGVATAAGVFAVLVPGAFAAASAVFVLTVWATRYISLGSIAAALALVTLVAVVGAPGEVVLGAALSAGVILHRHRTNLVRVVAGTERRVGQRLFEESPR